MEGGLEAPTYAALHKDLTRLCAHTDPRVPKNEDGTASSDKPSDQLAIISKGWVDATVINEARSKTLLSWLDGVLPLLDENNATEENRFDKIRKAIQGFRTKRFSP